MTSTIEEPQAKAQPGQTMAVSEEEAKFLRQFRATKKQSPIERIKANCPPGMSIKPPMEFELLQGPHFEDDLETGEERQYSAGDGRVIRTYNDLNKFNTEGFPPKFRQLNTAAPDGKVDPYRPIPGETREQYAERLAKMQNAHLAQFDSMTLLSATPGSQAPTTAQAQMTENLPQAPQQKPLEQMSEGELRKLASDEGLNLGKFKGNREQLLKTVKDRLKI